MVAIVSGNSLGLSLTSLATLGPQGVFGSPGLGQSGEQTYVNVANGNLVVQDRDDVLAATGLDAVALRTYNSQGLMDDDNKDNWTSGIFKTSNNLQVTGTLNAAGSTVTREAQDGARALYTFNGTVYVSTDGAGAYDAIAYNSTTQLLTWTDGSTGTGEVYNKSGVLQSATDGRGNTLTYAITTGLLNTVTTQSGEKYKFTYSGNNLMSISVKAATGSVISQRVSYTYDTSNRLTSVTVDLSPANASITDGKVYKTSYTYNSNGQLNSTTQDDGTKLTFAYDANGRIASVTDGVGKTTGYAYDTANRKTTVTDPLGRATVYAYDASGQLLSISEPAVGGVSQVTTYSYDAKGNVLTVTDPLLQQAVMTYDGNGNQLSQTDAAGNTITRTFDARNQLLTQSVYVVPAAGSTAAAQPLTTRYVYDTATQNEALRFVVSPEGRVTEYRYGTQGNSLGQLVSTLQYTVDKYNTAGLLPTAVPLLADMTAWVAGRVAQASFTEVTYDFRGQVATQTAWTGVDGTGKGIVDGKQSVTSFIYDYSGRLLQTVTPTLGTSPATARTTNYAYDGLGRVLSAVKTVPATPSGTTTLQTTSYSYDATNNRIAVTDNNDLITTSSYDKDGRLTSVKQGTAATPNLGTTQYFYDADSRLAMTQDPTGVRRWMLYDEAGRHVADIDGNGSVTEYVYDVDDQLTRTTRYARPLTATVLASLVDANGLPTNPALASIRPAASNGTSDGTDVTTWQIYDKAGRLVYSVDGQGGVTQTFYDGASRVTAVTQYATPVSTASLGNAPGALTVTASADDRTTHNDYSDDSLLQSSVDAEGNVTDYSYDAAGRLCKQLQHGSAGKPDSVNWTFYDGKGQVVARVDADNYLTENSYNLDGTLASTKRYARAVTATITATSTLATLRPVADALDRTTSWLYDTLGRIQQETDPLGIVTSYTYNAAGNLASTTRAFGQTEARTVSDLYDVQGRLTSETVTGAGSSSAVYDAAGRRMSSTDELGNTTLYFHDVDSRLNYTVNALGEVTQNVYNALGQLVTVVRYAGRISLTGLTGSKAGGLVNSTLTSAVAAIKNAALDNATANIYNAAGELTDSTDALGNTTHYDYNAFGEQKAVTRKADATHVLVQNRIYDHDGRLAFTVDAAGGVAQWSYDSQGRVIAHKTWANTLPAGTPLTFADLNSAVASTGFADAAHDMASYTLYDAALHYVFTVDATGAVVGQQYDARGNVTLRTAFANSLPAGTALTTAAVEAALLVPGFADATRDVTVRNVYDKDDRLVWSVDGVNAVTQRIYNKAGELVQLKEYATAIAPGADPATVQASSGSSGADRVTTYAYDTAGRLAYTVDALGGVTQNWYDAAGNLTQCTSYANSVTLGTDLSATAIGNLVSPDAINDRTAHFAYDAARRMAYSIDAARALTETQYDTLGHVTRTIEYATLIPATSLSTLAATASAATVKSLTPADPNGQNRTTAHTYNAAGRLASTTDSLGYVTKWLYDGVGRTTTTTQYANKSAQSSAADRVTRLDYYANGLLKTSTDALGHSESYTYNAVGDKLSFTNKNGSTWTYDYDAAGRMTKEISPAVTTPAGTSAPIVTQMVYDALGNLTARTEAAGLAGERTTQYTYDALGRQTQTTYPTVAVYDAAQDTLATTGAAARSETPGVVLGTHTYYDALGNAVANSDVAGNFSYKAYDKLGQVTYEMDAMGYGVHYSRDAFGQVTSLTRYAGRTVVPPTPQGFTQAQAASQAASLSTPQDRTILTTYDAMGRVKTVTEPQVFNYDSDKIGNGNPSSVQGKTTTNTWDAFGNLLRVSDGKGITDHFYDQLGQETGSVDAMGFVTAQTYDAMGNLSSHTEYATSVAPTGWSAPLRATAPTAASTPSDDRTTNYTYDALGRKTSQTLYGKEAGSTQTGGAVTQYSYDNVGNLVQTIDAMGGSTYSYYDALGRVYATITPPTGSAADASLATPLTEYVRDAFGNVVTQIARVHGAASASKTTFTRADASGSSDDRINYASFDNFGHTTATTDAQGSTHYFSYNARGDLAKTWQAVTDAGGVTSTIYQVMCYDALGRLTLIKQPAPTALGGSTPGVSTTALTWNAFGEMTRRQVDTQKAEYYDYDNAGRVWRTNTGDGAGSGVDHITLYDAQGRATQDIRSDGSGGSDVDITSFTRPDDAANAANLRKTTNYYDAAGRLIKQVLPQTQTVAVDVSVSRLTAGAAVVRSETLGQVLSNSGYQTGALSVLQTNQVQLSWTSLAALGSGEVKAVLSYTTQATTVNYIVSGGIDGQGNPIDVPMTRVYSATAQTVSRIFTSEQAGTGVLLDWAESDPNAAGIAQVTGVAVYKKDINGNWQRVINQATQGTGSNSVSVLAPADAATKVQLQARAVGDVSDTGWRTLAAINFGDRYFFDTSPLADGVYEYRVQTQRVSDAAFINTSTGTINLNPPPIAVIATAITATTQGSGAPGVYTWQSPGSGVTETFRYRAVGSSGAWATLTVAAQKDGSGLPNGLDGVDASSLPTGSYDYELLYTYSHALAPYAHATGRISVVAPAGTQPVPEIAFQGNADGTATVRWATPQTAIRVSYMRLTPVADSSPTVVPAAQITLDADGKHQQTVIAPGALPGNYQIKVEFLNASGATWAVSTGTLTVNQGPTVPASLVSTTPAYVAANGTPPISNVQFLTNPDGSWSLVWPAAPVLGRSQLQMRPKGTTTWQDQSAGITAAGSTQRLDKAAHAFANGDWDIQLKQYDSTGAAVGLNDGTLTFKADTTLPPTIAGTTPAYTPATPQVMSPVFTANADGTWSLSWPTPSAGTTAFISYRATGSTGAWTSKTFTTAGATQTASFGAMELAAGSWDIDLYQMTGTTRTAQANKTVTLQPPTFTAAANVDTTPAYVPAFSVPNYLLRVPGFGWVANSPSGSTFSWNATPAGSMTVFNYRAHSDTVPNPNPWLLGASLTSTSPSSITTAPGVPADGIWDFQFTQVNLATNLATSMSSGVLTVSNNGVTNSLYSTWPKVAGFAFTPVSGNGSSLSWATPPAGYTAALGYRPHGSTGAYTPVAFTTNGSVQSLALPAGSLPNGDWDVGLAITYNATGELVQSTWGFITANGATHSYTDSTTPWQPATYAAAQGLPRIGVSFSSAANGSWSVQWPAPAAGTTTTFNYRLVGATSWSSFTSKIVSSAGVETASLLPADLAPGSYQVDIFQTTGGVRVRQFQSTLAINGTPAVKATVVDHTPAYQPQQNYPVIVPTYTGNADGTWKLQWPAPTNGATVKFMVQAPGTTVWTDYTASVVTSGSTQSITGPAGAAPGTYKVDLSFNQGATRTAQYLANMVAPNNAVAPTMVGTPSSYVAASGIPPILGVGFAGNADGSWVLSWPHAPAGSTSVLNRRANGTSGAWTAVTPITVNTTTGIDSVTIGKADWTAGKWDLDLYYQNASSVRTQQALGTLTTSTASTVAPTIVGDPGSYEPGSYSVTQTTDASGALLSTAPVFVALAAPVNISGLNFLAQSDGSARFVWDITSAQLIQSFQIRASGASSWTALSTTLYTNVLGAAQQSVVVPASLGAGSYDIQLTLVPIPIPGMPTPALGSLQGTLVMPEGANGTGVPQPIEELTDTDTPLTMQAVVQRQVDRWGNVLQTNDARNLAWTTNYTYNAWNQLVTQTQTDGAGLGDASHAAVTTIAHDKLGRQTSIRDANGYYNTQTLDAAGNLLKETHADGGSISYRYNIFGDKTQSKTQITSTTSVTTDYDYDKLGRLKTTTYAAVGVAHINYLTWTLASDGSQRLTETNDWDEAGRKIRHTATDGQQSVYTYDLRGNVIQSVDSGVTTKMAYDTQGRMTGQTDGNLKTASWTYDHFGQLTGHTDLGGATYTYEYDKARQLTRQYNSRTGDQKLDIRYGYDKSGNLLSIDSKGQRSTTAGGVTTVTPTEALTQYAYDLAGHRIREVTKQGDVVAGQPVYTTMQDNHLSYDALGRLQWVSDNRATVSMQYDKVGNRSEIKTHVLTQSAPAQNQQQDTAHDSDEFFSYDAMNRQTRANVDANGALGANGHQIGYDYAGNKVSDSWINSQGAQTTESYSNDAMNHVTAITRDGTQVDARYYDSGGRLVQSGIQGLSVSLLKTLYGTDASGQLLAGTGTEVHKNLYDGNGRLIHETVRTTDGVLRYESYYTKPDSTSNYDGAGNLLGYTFNTSEGRAGQQWKYTYTYTPMEGYKQTDVTAIWQGPNEQSTTKQTFDGNGFLVSMTQTNKDGTTTKTYANDASGKVLYADDGSGHIQRELIANGEVLGRYGETLDAKASTIANKVYTTTADFSFGYSATGGNLPASQESMHTIMAGDSLQSIAQAAYGDSSLWYLIADANGIGGNSGLTPGQVLRVPSAQVSGNNANTFKPYDPSAVVGNSSPVLTGPVNGGGCGALGQILMIVVAVVATMFTAGALTVGLSGSLGSIMSAGTTVLTGGTLAAGTVTTGFFGSVGAIGVAATAGAVGSILSQAVGIAAGVQDSFNWKGVALGALSAGVTAGVGSLATGALAGPGMGAVVGRAVIANALSQGIGVVTGLQSSFSWRAVAVSAVGAAVSSVVGDATGMNDQGFAGRSWDQQFGPRLLTGLATNAATAVARGGRISAAQIVTDAFGNALGESIANGSSSAGQPELMTGDFARKDGESYRSEPYEAPYTGNGLLLRSGGLGLQMTPAAYAAMTDGIAGSATAVAPDEIASGQVDDGQDVFRRSERQYRQATDTGAAIRAGDTLEKLSGGNKEVMGRYIRGMGLSNPNLLQIGQSMRADWSISSDDAVSISNQFYKADALAKSAAADAAMQALLHKDDVGLRDYINSKFAGGKADQLNSAPPLGPATSNSRENNPVLFAQNYYADNGSAALARGDTISFVLNGAGYALASVPLNLAVCTSYFGMPNTKTPYAGGGVCVTGNGDIIPFSGGGSAGPSGQLVVSLNGPVSNYLVGPSYSVQTPYYGLGGGVSPANGLNPLEDPANNTYALTWGTGGKSASATVGAGAYNIWNKTWTPYEPFSWQK